MLLEQSVIQPGCAPCPRWPAGARPPRSPGDVAVPHAQGRAFLAASEGTLAENPAGSAASGVTLLSTYEGRAGTADELESGPPAPSRPRLAGTGAGTASGQRGDVGPPARRGHDLLRRAPGNVVICL